MRVGRHDADPGGCKPQGVVERPVIGFRDSTGVAGKRQAGSFDLGMVAWKRAVVPGERKAAATGRLWTE